MRQDEPIFVLATEIAAVEREPLREELTAEDHLVEPTLKGRASVVVRGEVVDVTARWLGVLQDLRAASAGGRVGPPTC